MNTDYKNAQIQVNAIKKLYLEMRSKGMLSKEQILQQNITEIMWEGLLKAIERGEIVNIAIRGKTGSSKSTTGCKLLVQLIKKMIRIGKIKRMDEKELQEYLYTRISSDQTEFLRFAMKDAGQTVALIDEFSSMGEVGFNATMEKSMYAEHSDLYAQEYIHKIACSPTYINDRNADIILDFVGRDDKLKVSQFILNYRDHTEWLTYPLGTVNIYVGDIMEQEFYKRYRKKKFARLDLLKKHGIKNVRELEFARITLETYDELKGLAMIKRQTNESILGIMDGIRRKNRMQYSILTLNYIVMNVKSMLDIATEINALRKKLEKCKVEEDAQIIKMGLEKYRKILKDRVLEEQAKIDIEKVYREIRG